MALFESEKLLQQIPKSKLPDIDFYFLPALLACYGQLTLTRMLNLMSKFARLVRLVTIADVLVTWRGIVTGGRALEQLLKNNVVSVIVVADDRSLGWEYGLVLAARERGIRTVAIPFALSDPEADCLSRKGERLLDPDCGWGFERWLKRRMRELYPSNIWVYRGKEIMFLTTGQAWTLMKAKGQFGQPWAYGGGITDLASVFGDFDYRKQISLGVNPKKMIITGQSSVDLLYQNSSNAAQIRTALIRDYKLREDQLVIICAVPQYYEHGLMSKKKHWVLFEQLLSSLASIQVNLVLSLHPRSRRQDYQDIADKYGATLANQSLVEFIAGGDLFVSAMSSTVRWAMLLNIPTIVLDDLQQDGQLIIPRNGAHFVNKRSELVPLVKRLLFNSKEREKAKHLQAKVARELDPFDGLNSTRLVQLLIKLSRKTANLT